jgi:hypothetical protein
LAQPGVRLAGGSSELLQRHYLEIRVLSVTADFIIFYPTEESVLNLMLGDDDELNSCRITSEAVWALAFSRTMKQELSWLQPA